MSTLILLRHGESEWNALNLFTGWVDVDLTEKGVAEAGRAGLLLADSGVLPSVVHTSVMRRAIRTTNLALDVCDRHWIPVRRSWRLNERHYGALQGKNKKQTLEEYGQEQFMLWRRSYDTPPPAIDPDDEYSQMHDARYAALPPEVRPLTECLKDVVARMLPWYDAVVPDLETHGTVMIGAPTATRCAPWSSTSTGSRRRHRRAQHPDRIPLVYELDAQMRPTGPGQYLDPAAAESAAAAVANQGKS